MSPGGGYIEDASVVEAETVEDSSAVEAEDEAEEEEPEAEPVEEPAEEEPQEEAAAESEEVEEEPAEDEGDVTVSAQATSGTCGDNLTWKYSSGTLTISGTGDMTNWSYSSRAPWRQSYYSSITSIVIEAGVTSIGDYAFSGCEVLTNVTIGSGVTSIGEFAFLGCDSLTSLTVGKGVTTIEDYAFSHCEALTTLTIPESVVTIGKSICYSGGDLTDVFYTGSKEAWAAITVGEYNSELDSATIHYNSSYGINGVCGNNLTWLLDSNGTLTIEGSGAMTDWESLDYGECESAWGNYSSSIKKVVIGDNVTTIGSYAFNFCESLQSVTFGSGLTTIGEGAFTYCVSLTSVDIPDNVTTIGKFAFWYCNSLNEVTIGNGVTSIGAQAFDECVNLATVNLGTALKSIGNYAFYDCLKLKTITIPTSVTSIGTMAIGFANNENLDEYDWKGSSPYGLVMYCYSGSTAQTWAENNGISYVILDLSTPTISGISNTTSGVKITWKAVTGATGYRVYRKAAGDSSWTTVKSSTTSTSYTDTTAKSGITYYYTVRAYVKASGSTYWGSYNKTGKSIKYLTAGKISTLTNTSSGVTVKWSKVTGASGYKIYRKTSSGSYSLIKTITSGSTVSYTDTAVKSKNGTTYVYAVRPYSGSYTGSYTGKTTVRLTGVSISSLTNVKTKKMTVKWGKNTKATGYQIQYSTSSSFSSGNKTVTVSGSSSVSKTISSLTKGKKYYVRVRVYKTVSGTKYYSAWSGTKNVKISK